MGVLQIYVKNCVLAMSRWYKVIWLTVHGVLEYWSDGLTEKTPMLKKPAKAHQCYWMGGPHEGVFPR